MAVQIRIGSNDVEKTLVNELNNLRDAMVGTNFHASATSNAPTGDPPTATVLQITAANGNGTLPVALTLVNQIKNIVNIHFQDTYAHRSAVSAKVTTADATDLASAITLANALKTAYNTGGHINAANVHFTADGTNTIAAVNATDQASLDTLLNELKGDINAHISAALAGNHIQLLSA